MMRRWLAGILGTLVLMASGTLHLRAQQFPAPPGWKWVTAKDAKLVGTLAARSLLSQRIVNDGPPPNAHGM